MKNNFRIGCPVFFGAIEHRAFEAVDDLHLRLLGNLFVEVEAIVSDKKNVAVICQDRAAVAQDRGNAINIIGLCLFALAFVQRADLLCITTRQAE